MGQTRSHWKLENIFNLMKIKVHHIKIFEANI